MASRANDKFDRKSCLRVRYKMAEAECTRDQNIHAWRDLWWQHWRRGISCRHCVVWDQLFVAPRRDVSSWRNCCNYYTNWHFAVLTKVWVCNLSVISCFSNTKRGLLRFLPTWLPTHQHSYDQKNHFVPQRVLFIYKIMSLFSVQRIIKIRVSTVNRFYTSIRFERNILWNRFVNEGCHTLSDWTVLTFHSCDIFQFQ